MTNWCRNSRQNGEMAILSLWKRVWLCLCAGWFSILLSGCTPSTPGQSADQREPHFVLGENRIDAMDYRGAIRAFEESLEVDPHSAAAQFQLGWLYDVKVPDPAAAIYHYEQYLKLAPAADNATVVKQRIEACKQALAADVLGLPSMPAAQRRVEQLTAQNEQLQDENQRLQEENQQLRVDLNRWSAYCASLLAAQTNSLEPAARGDALPHATVLNDVYPASAGTEAQPPAVHIDRRANPAPDSTTAWRAHVVTPGETAIRIARSYGVSLAALFAANPGLDPRRMPVGLVLNIPPP
jgi:tetratricopeptide (TPR) repeat protein